MTVDEHAPGTLFSIMLRRLGSASYAATGSQEIARPPARGARLSLSIDGRAVSGVVDELFTPPGCDEHCIGTMFVTETDA